MSDRPKVIRSSHLEWIEQERGSRFKSRRQALGKAAGSQKLGCSLYEVPPGYRAWPYHAHCANEEAIYVLSGCGTLRLAGEEIAIASGDYVALPAGKNAPHQIVNTSDEVLRYLCFSTMLEPDVTLYPDSGKIGVFAGSPPGGAKEERIVSHFFQPETAVDYWMEEE